VKAWLLCFLWFCPWLPAAETPLPPKPNARLYDPEKLLDTAAEDTFSRALTTEKARNNVDAWVVIYPNLKNGETAFADQLRDAWVVDPVGFVILYTPATDKISISLTDEAFTKMAAKGSLQDVASQVDAFNVDGPSRALPRVMTLLLDRLRTREAPSTLQGQDYPDEVLIAGGAGMLLLLAWGLLRISRYLTSHLVFSKRYALKSPPVTPMLGSKTGGINTAGAKF